ncbi:YfbM family protein [Dactylosporangium sp. NPDC050588]|uniref:YfbM family protein n=1 Tax=Dactylosporangium sp. NPDC050588 TaxID=3157211 RepID=UPI003405810C
MLGVHFAITAKQEKKLLKAADRDEDEVAALLGDLEEEWDDESMKVDTDKAWDAVHRCLTGSLDADAGEYPLTHAVLGGRDLLEEDYYAVYVTADEVRDVAAALRDLDRAWLRERFDAFDKSDYAGAGDDQDFEYTWSNFADIQAFYDRAAAAGRAVVFTAM